MPGNRNASGSFGRTSQVFRVGGVSAQGTMGMQDTELWFRSVEAVNGTVSGDVERMMGKEVISVVNQDGGVEMDVMFGRQQQVVLGRDFGL